MKLSEIKNHLHTLSSVTFLLPDGKSVPAHFHVTEVGKITKDFIDCGGVVRHEEVISFQLWESIDVDHRIEPSKLMKIIELSEEKLGLENHEIEVEYQAGTIGKFGLDFDGENFVLTNKLTDCLAKDNCGVPKLKLDLSLMTADSGSSCTPGGGCC